jgi:hypothetical protein
VPYLDLAAIKNEISLKMVLDHVGWKCKTSKEGELRGPCPLEGTPDRKSRSFAVKDDGFFCHHCKENGDQFRFWCLYYKVAFMAAVHQMCEAFKVPEYQLPRRLWAGQRANGEEER